MITRLFFAHLFILLAVGIGSDACLGQTPEPITSPAIELQSVEPLSAGLEPGPQGTDQISGAVNENVNGPQNSSPSSSLITEPLTRQARESSTEITPADRRIMSDIQEIRAMLGGGLEREFEEINQVLQQHPASVVSPANDRPGTAVVQEDRAAAQGDSFSRELGQMIRARSQLLPPNQVAPKPQQRRGSRQSFLRGESRSAALPGDDPRSALRQCARELELVAGALEQIEAYENADSVRREAAQLWEKARKIGPVTP